MRWNRSGILLLLLEGAAACHVPITRADASLESAVRDASPDDVRPALADTGSDSPSAPWLDPEFRLPREQLVFSPSRRRPCGGFAPIAFGGPVDNYRAHSAGGWFYYSAYGSLIRFRIGDSLIEGMSDRSLGGLLGLRTGKFLAAFTDQRSFTDAVIEYDHPELAGRGRVIWQFQRRPTESEAGWYGFSATDSLIAFAWRNSIEAGTSVVLIQSMNPDGTGVRVHNWEPRFQHSFGELRASGDRFVVDMAGQVKVWQRGDPEPRAISPSNSPQWHPWIDGTRVVWIDQRHGPRGTRVDPDNPEVYYSDLATGEVRRITHDPVDRPVVQDAVTIEGDWIAWSDLRNASQPNGSFLGDRVDVYGYHIPTGTEVQLVSDPRCPATQPVLLAGRLFFTGYPMDGGGAPPLYMASLPTMPQRRDE
ncbi:MAG: hypothetical protein JNK05_26630 [Myxococcales bacterium]|nr:hypothetical protein [Myxococcales bacterium]